MKSTTPIICSGFKVNSFLNSQLSQGRCEYRVLGLASNASLICRLMTHGCRVYVGTPAVCPTVAARRDSAQALQCAMGVCGAPSVGGWHLATEHDRRTYELISTAQWCRTHGGLRGSRSLQRLLRRHPAWSALSFPLTGSLAGRVRLIEAIVDPRWYVDPERPNSKTRLHSYLGLHPDTILRLLGLHGAKFQPSTAFLDRASAVLSAWGATGRRPSDLSQQQDSRQFLWRIYTDPKIPHRCLRAARTYATFVSQVWLDAITKTTGDGLFDPKTTLRRPNDVDAYAQYLKRNDYAGR